MQQRINKIAGWKEWLVFIFVTKILKMTARETFQNIEIYGMKPPVVGGNQLTIYKTW